MEDKRMETKKEHLRLELDSLSQNEEFARVVTAVFMSRLNPTLEEIDDVKTAVSEAVTNVSWNLRCRIWMANVLWVQMREYV